MEIVKNLDSTIEFIHNIQIYSANMNYPIFHLMTEKVL